MRVALDLSWRNQNGGVTTESEALITVRYVYLVACDESVIFVFSVPKCSVLNKGIAHSTVYKIDKQANRFLCAFVVCCFCLLLLFV